MGIPLAASRKFNAKNANPNKEESASLKASLKEKRSFAATPSWSFQNFQLFELGIVFKAVLMRAAAHAVVSELKHRLATSRSWKNSELHKAS